MHNSYNINIDMTASILMLSRRFLV